MLALDAIGDTVADTLRDAMGSIWLGLSDEEHALLDNRTVLFSEGSKLTVREDLFGDVLEEPVVIHRSEPISVSNWECTAA